ncbi:MAG: Ycf66 family protein [Cyanobacteria bacterium MAG CAR3_bin_5]|nr:Ycf66 family protein [Cyanobacteria bacterium MAG CAR3_bin_5]
MVNTSLNWVSIVGIVLMVGGSLLYSLRFYKPALSRDTDVFFAAVGLLCGGILFFQGWRLDPILQFSQFLLATTTGFFVYESLRLRGVTAEQARRREFMDDSEGNETLPRAAVQPIGSRLDEWDSLEQRPPMRRPALAAGGWDTPPSRRPIRRASEEEPPWRDAPPLPPRQDWDREVPQSPRASRGRPSRRGLSPRRSQLEPSREQFPSRSERSTGRGIDSVERRLVGRRQRRPAMGPEPFDQDPNLKLARSAPRTAPPPQGAPLKRNQNPRPRWEDQQDNSGRFDK